MSGEVVSLFLGQCGTQVASACWELFCLEHGVRTDGLMYKNYKCNDDSHTTFFSATKAGKLSPRSVIVDLEPTAIDEIRTGSYKNLFDPKFLITGKEDAANNYARGYNTVGKEMIGLLLDRIRRATEACSNLAGFMIFRLLYPHRSFGGGTGSGLTTLMLESLYGDYDKKTKVNFSIYPAPNISTSVVEPYNTILTTNASMEFEDCCFLMDNEALYDICEKKLDVLRPTYTNLNRLTAQAVSNITTSMRFSGLSGVHLSEIHLNLVPYPRIHYPLVVYSPIMTPEEAVNSQLTVQEITNDCFSPTHQMVKCNPRLGVYMSCCLLYRGEVHPGEVKKAVTAIKDHSNIRFANWSPNSFKIGINYRPPLTVPGGDLAKSDKSVVMLSNTTVINRAWKKVRKDAQMMYKKKAFVHHYVAEGMEESQFDDALENISTLIQDYSEVEK